MKQEKKSKYFSVKIYCSVNQGGQISSPLIMLTEKLRKNQIHYLSKCKKKLFFCLCLYFTYQVRKASLCILECQRLFHKLADNTTTIVPRIGERQVKEGRGSHARAFNLRISVPLHFNGDLCRTKIAASVGTSSPDSFQGRPPQDEPLATH